MSSSDVRDVTRPPAIIIGISHPPEQPQRPTVKAAARPRRLAAYLARVRTSRRAARWGTRAHGGHDRVTYEQAVRSIAFRFLK